MSAGQIPRHLLQLLNRFTNRALQGASGMNGNQQTEDQDSDLGNGKDECRPCQRPVYLSGILCLLRNTVAQHVLGELGH